LRNSSLLWPSVVFLLERARAPMCAMIKVYERTAEMTNRLVEIGLKVKGK